MIGKPVVGADSLALKELIKNMDNLPSEAKNQLLQDILARVDGEEGKALRNEVLKEMLRNAENMDEETRQRIIQQVLDKLATDGEADVRRAFSSSWSRTWTSCPSTCAARSWTR